MLGGIHESIFRLSDPKIIYGAKLLPIVPTAPAHPYPKLLTLVGKS